MFVFYLFPWYASNERVVEILLIFALYYSYYESDYKPTRLLANLFYKPTNKHSNIVHV